MANQIYLLNTVHYCNKSVLFKDEYSTCVKEDKYQSTFQKVNIYEISL